MKEASRESERLCFVHNTLKRAVPVITNINYNGKLIYSSTLGPERVVTEKSK
jgi:hypothetical protein